MKKETQTKYISPAEVGRIMGVSASTVRRWAESFPEFPTAHRVGPQRQRRYALDEIEHYFEEHKEGISNYSERNS